MMLTKVFSAALQGIDATEVMIEVHTGGGGEPMIIVVGLPDVIVRESKDRILAALTNSGYQRPKRRTTINLAPADIKKQGPSFDLPMALGLITQEAGIRIERLEHCYIAGELALTGEIRPIKGALALTLEAKRNGKKAILLPLANAAEASLVEGISVYGVEHLSQAYRFLTREISLSPIERDLSSLLKYPFKGEVDFADVKGQEHVKRSLEVAIAGGHNILLVGPPGSGKSMLAQRIPSIMPPMSLSEALETTKIHSICGLLSQQGQIVQRRPFRAPHHTISDVGLLGGSATITPGEISMAHHGVLFLDELPEFRRSTLEVLRQPLEEGRVTISRAAGTMTFPADFILVAAMNPCPCGYHGDPTHTCRCSSLQLERYRQRISGPLLDRIDLHIEAPALSYQELTQRKAGESSQDIRARVEQARDFQYQRLTEKSLMDQKKPSSSRTYCNANMSSKEVRKFCQLSSSSEKLLEKAINELHFSARSYDRILKVARTIADLAQHHLIEEEDLLEALSYRYLDRAH